MARSGHVIDTAVFDVSFDWPDDDVDRSTALVDLVRGRLLVVAEEVFDELGPPDGVATIESLEIDLGVVARDDASEELPRRFRARLREALEGQIHPLGTEPGPAARVVPVRQAELEDVQHFLRTGRLPWSAGGVGASAFDEMARRVAELDGPRLVEFLRASADAAALERVLQQLPEAALRQLLAGLDPDRSDRLARLYEEIKSALDRTPLDWRTRDDLELGFWLALLIPLLRHPSAADLGELADGALEALRLPAGEAGAAARAPLTEAVAIALGTGAAPVEGPTTVSVEAPEAALESVPTRAFGAALDPTPDAAPEAAPEAALGAALDPTPDAAPEAEPAKSPERPPRRRSPEEEREEEYEARLAEALVSGAGARLRELWPALLAEHQDLVRRVVARHVRREGVRHAVAEGFPPAMYMDVVRLLDPAAAEYVAELLEHARVFAAGRKEWGGVKARLREHTLAHLVEQRGEFEPGPYLAALIRRVAEDEGASADETRAAVAEKLRRSGSAAPFRAEMLALITELAVADARRADEERWAAHQARLDAAASSRDVSGLVDLWEVLARERPDLIERAALRLAEREGARRTVADDFPTATFLDVVRALDAGASAYVAELLRHADAFAIGGVASEAEARTRLREHTLVYLVARGAAFEPLSFIASLIGSIVEAEGTSSEMVRASVAAALRAAPAPGGGPAIDAFREELRARFEDPGPRRLEPAVAEAAPVVADSDAVPPPSAEPAAPERSGAHRSDDQDDDREKEKGKDGEKDKDEDEEYEARLAEALLSGAVSRLRDLWPVLLVERPDLVHRVVTRYARRADVRRAVAERFPAPMFLDLVRVLDLAASVYVGELLERGRMFAGGGKASAGVRVRLREHTLAYLVEAGGAPFERRPYLASLIARLQEGDDADADETRTTLAALRRSADLLALIAEVEPGAQAARDPDAIHVERLDAALASGDATGLGDLWTVLARDRGDLLERAVLRQAVREDARRAIARGFPPEMFVDVVRVLAPGAPEWVAELLRRADVFALGRAAGAPDGAARLREHVLGILVDERGAPFEPRTFVAALIDRLAGAEGTSAESVRASILTALAAAGVAPRAAAAPDVFGAALIALVARAEPTELPGRAEAGEPWAMREAHLEAALESGDAARFRELWPALARERPELAERAVARWARREGARRAALERFPAELFLDVVRVLAPDAGPYMAALLGRSEAFALGENAPDVAFRLREHAIAYLMARRGAAFEPRGYVASLIALRAEATGTSAERVRAAAAAALRAVPALHTVPGAVGAELLALLTVPAPVPAAEAPHHPLDRAAREAAERARRPGVGRREAAALLRAYDLMEVVRTVVWGRSVPSSRAESVGPAIEELARAYPRRLVALIGELRAAGAGAPVLAFRLSAADLRRMVEAWLDVSAERSSDGPDRVRDLRHAILSFGARALHPHRYFAAVLDQLAAGSLLDFEEILAEVAAEAPAAETAPSAEAGPEPTLAGGMTLGDLDRYLADGVVTARATPPRLLALVESLLPEQADRLASWLASRLELRAARERLVGLLPENALARILDALWPGDWARAQTYVDLVEDVSFLAGGPPVPRQLTWRFTLDWLAGGRRPFEDAEFARHLLDELSARLAWGELGDLESRIRARLAEEAPSSYAAPREDEAAPATLPTALVSEALLSPAEPGEATRIENAGLVLATPYLPRLFSMLEFLTEDGKGFQDRQAAARAAQLTQFVVTGREDTPEFLLFLNRILCGIPTNQPLPRRFEPSDRERNAVEGLLRAMIQHWGAIGNTSIAGLRESFLQRGGTLELDEDTWNLRVEEKGFDVLLDRVPWTFKTIRFPWMRNVVQVEWR